MIKLRDSPLLRVWLERAPGYNEYIKIIDGNVAGSVADPGLSKEWSANFPPKTVLERKKKKKKTKGGAD